MSEEKKQAQESVAAQQETVESTAVVQPENAVEPIGDASQKATKGGAHTTPKRNKYADMMSKKKKRLSKKASIILAVSLAALLIGLGIYLVARSRNSGTAEQANTIGYATRGMLETYIEGDGTTAAKKREELGKELKGKVSEVLVEVGQQVSEGDTLLIVNPTETRKELETAISELTDTQRAVSDAQADVTKAQNEVNSAKKDQSKLNITAPFTGKIVPASTEGAATSFKVGQQLSQGTVIGSMVDDSQMTLPLYFSYAYINDVKSGQTATVSIPSAMSTVTGKVDSIEKVQKVSAEGVKLFRVVIRLSNPGTLTKGMLATATINTSAGELYPAESGSLEYNREEEITAQVSGEIVSANGIDNHSYNSGASIIRMTSDSVQTAIQNAQSGVVSAQNAVVNAQKQVQAKQERIKELNTLIENATIKSPIDGVIVSLPVTVDQEVTGTGALCVVADMSDIVVNANITATDVSAVQPGQVATITMYTNEGEATFTGTVQSVSMEASQNQNNSQGSMPTFPAIIQIDPIEGQTLRPDYPVQYKITTAQSMDCITVPSSAVVNTEEGTAVFARPAEGQEFENVLPLPEGTENLPEGFVLVPVEVGIADSTNTEILWGIDEGTEVYLAGPEDMNAGMGDGMTVAVG